MKSLSDCFLDSEGVNPVQWPIMSAQRCCISKINSKGGTLFKMKKDVVEFVSKCFICQQVKAEYQLSGGGGGGLLKPLEVHTWKWECMYSL